MVRPLDLNLSLPISRNRKNCNPTSRKLMEARQNMKLSFTVSACVGHW